MSKEKSVGRALRITLWILISVLCIVLIASLAFFWSLSSSGSRAENQTFTLQEGWGVRDISNELQNKGVIPSQWLFIAAVILNGSSDQLQAGDYVIPKDASIREIVTLFSKGEENTERNITILEGWGNDDIAAYLEKQGILSRRDFLAAADVTDSRELFPDTIFPALSGKTATVSLQGYLYPDTYRIFKDATAKDIVQKMLQNFEKKLTAEDRQKIAAQNRSIFDVVTLASIVEKEEKKSADKRIVAGIFLKRLSIGMPLQSDATVNYATGKDLRSPTYDDLQVNSPYNTYKYAGLPPGPINNPSIDTIRAVIEPTESDYLYFLHPLSGETIYSKTAEEHTQNKFKYLK